MIIATPYKNFTYMLEFEKEIGLFEDKFNESVLKNVDLSRYRIIDKFIQSMLEIYTFALYDVSQKRDSNLSGKFITENKYLKDIFLRLIEEQNIIQAVDVLLLKHSSKKLDNSFSLELGLFSSKSFSKDNLFIAIKYDIDSKIAKYLLDEKNINGLARYLQEEILQRVYESKEKFKIGKIDKECFALNNEELAFEKTVLVEKLLDIVESCQSTEEFWEKY